MAYTVSKIIEIAKREVGYNEKTSPYNLDEKVAPNDGGGNYTKYSRDLAAAGYYQASKQGYDWCDVFVDWCFYQLTGKNKEKAEDMQCQTGPYGAGVGFSARYYKAQNRYSTTPQVGDQIFFGDMQHTGLIVALDNKYIYTVEGNSGGAVRSKRYTRGNGYVTGFGHPKYDPEPAEPEPVPDPKPVPQPVPEKTFSEQFVEMRKELQDNDAGPWSIEARDWAVKNGIVFGIGNGPDGKPNYAWEDIITREQMVCMLYRALHQGV